jgi:hypothetical protein
MRYLHHKSQENEAELLADAFRPASVPKAELSIATPDRARDVGRR